MRTAFTFMFERMPYALGIIDTYILRYFLRDIIWFINTTFIHLDFIY